MMHLKKLTGFSLIELMITITIIGILAAVAVPAYTTYTSKANLARDLAFLDYFKPQLMESYNTIGQLPNQITLGSTVIPVNTPLPTPINQIEDIQGVFYSVCNSGLGGNPCKAFITVDSKTVNYDINNPIFIAFGYAIIPNSDGSLQFYCGYWHGGTATPQQLAMLPSSCVQTNLAAL